jgi:hypothetical protein
MLELVSHALFDYVVDGISPKDLSGLLASLLSQLEKVCSHNIINTLHVEHKMLTDHWACRTALGLTRNARSNQPLQEFRLYSDG